MNINNYNSQIFFFTSRFNLILINISTRAIIKILTKIKTSNFIIKLDVFKYYKIGFYSPIAAIIEADILLYVPFSKRSLIASKAFKVNSTSSKVCVAVGIKRNKINPFGITG